MKNLIQKTIDVLNEIPNQKTSFGSSYDLVSEIQSSYQAISERHKNQVHCLSLDYHMADDADTDMEQLYLDVVKKFPLYQELSNFLKIDVEDQFQELYDEAIKHIETSLGVVY